MNEEDGDVGAMLFRRDERSRCSVEELVTQGPDPGIEIRVEQGPTESINPRREIGPRNGSTAIVIFADKLVTERFIRLGLDADRQFLRSGGAQDNEIGVPLLAAKIVEGNDALWNPSVRTTSPAGNNRRRKSRNSAGGAALAVLNHDLASSFALR